MLRCVFFCQFVRANLAYFHAHRPLCDKIFVGFRMKRINFILTLMLTFAAATHAQDMSRAKLIKISRSGKTFILNRGHLDQLKVGTLAKMFNQRGSRNNPELVYIGEAEAVHVLPKKSYWYFQDLDNSSIYRECDILTYATQEKNLSGRPVRLKTRKIVLPQGKGIVRYLREEDLGMRSELIFKASEFEKGKDYIRTDIQRDEHIIAKNFEVWKRKQGLEYIDEYINKVEAREQSGISERINRDKVKRKEEKEIFDSTITGIQAKINNLDFGLTGLYKEQEKDAEIREITKRVQIENVYEKKQRERREERFIGPYAVEKIRRQGQRWSADLNDEELRRFFIQSGIEKERRRQEFSLDRRAGNEVLLRATTELANKTTVEDNNNQNTGYSLLIGYEFHLSRTHLEITQWTVEFNAERALRYYDLGGINGRFEEGSFFGAVNYYLFNRPDMVRRYLFYGGIGIRRGNATVTSPSLSKDYEFSFFSIPTIQAGAKYRFSAGDERQDGFDVGVGANFLIQSELTRYSSTSEVTDDIAALFITTNLRLSFGFSIYF